MKRRLSFDPRFGDEVEPRWTSAVQRAADRAARTGRRHLVRRADWSPAWLVQEIR